MAIDKIEFMYPMGVRQSINSVEELTALELAGRTANKMNEVVDIANVIEQSANESRLVVDEMVIQQQNFILENDNARQEMILQNTELIEDLTESNENFKKDINTSKDLFETKTKEDLNIFKGELNTSKESFETSLNESKGLFETNMNKAVTDIISNADEKINTDVNNKIDGLINDGTIEELINDQILGDVKESIKSDELSLSETTGYGVIIGLKVTPQSNPNMSVVISNGIAHLYNGKRFNLSESVTFNVPKANDLYPRIDIVYINNSGVLSYGNGEPKESPLPPKPFNSLVLAEINVNTSTVVINSNNITDKIILKKDLPSFVNEVELSFTHMIEHDSISPDYYVGSDAEKVQKAINDANKFNRSVKLDRIYDISTSTLIIDNPDNIVTRKPIYILGVNGGGLKKNVSGFMFTSNIRDHGDIKFDNVNFISISGNGMKVFDCDKLIRLTISNCFFKNVDTVLYTSDLDGYVQSVRIESSSIIGGKGFAIDIVGAYDLRLDNLLVETRESFFNHRNVGAHNYITGCSMRACTVEGLTGTTMIIGSTKSFEISNNYFELNSKMIEFLPSSIIIGFKFDNNAYFGDLINSTSFVKWNGVVYGASSSNNINGDFPMHDTTNITSGYVHSFNDGYSPSLFKNIDTGGRLIIDREMLYKSYTQPIDNMVGYTTSLGNFKRLTSIFDSFTLVEGEQRIVSVPFKESITYDDFISVQTVLASVADKITICSVVKNGTNVWVTVRNDDIESKTINNLFVTVLKPYMSITG